MSDVILTIHVPQELADQINAATDQPIETFLIESAQNVLQRKNAIDLNAVWRNPPPPWTMAEKEDYLAQMLPPERLPEALQRLHDGKPIFGLFEGAIQMSDDFDDELPDEEWGDLFT